MTDATIPSPDHPDGAPVAGEFVELESVIPSEAEMDAARSRAISRTDSQVFQGTLVVTVLVWVLRLNEIDLNPLPGAEDIPAEVAAALGGLISVLVARWMNRRPRP